MFCATFENEDTLKIVSDDKCDSERKYNDTRNCTAEADDCKGEWFAGPWSKVQNKFLLLNLKILFNNTL